MLNRAVGCTALQETLHPHSRFETPVPARKSSYTRSQDIRGNRGGCALGLHDMRAERPRRSARSAVFTSQPRSSARSAEFFRVQTLWRSAERTALLLLLLTPPTQVMNSRGFDFAKLAKQDGTTLSFSRHTRRQRRPLTTLHSHQRHGELYWTARRPAPEAIRCPPVRGQRAPPRQVSPPHSSTGGSC